MNRIRTFRISFVTIALALGFCFLTSLANVNFQVVNKELKTDIGKFTDEKAVLRARYHSKVSASNLTTKADNFKMVPKNDFQTVDKKLCDAKDSKKNGLFSNVLKNLDNRIIVSGY